MTDRTNHSLFLACVHLVRSGLVWSGKKFCLWVWSEGRNQQPSFCVWGHFAWCNKQPNIQPGDPRRSLPLSFAMDKKWRDYLPEFDISVCTIFFWGSRFQFWKTWSQKKCFGVSFEKLSLRKKILVSATLVSRKCQIWFWNIWSKKWSRLTGKRQNKSKEKGIIVCCWQWLIHELENFNHW